MELNKLKKSRYVTGLKLTAGTFAVINFIFCLTVLLIPTAETEIAKTLFPLVFLLGFVFTAAISLRTNLKNYNLLLFASLLVFFLIYFSINFLQILDLSLSGVDIEKYSGRLLDYQYILQLFFLIGSVMYLRFKVTLFICIAILILTIIQIIPSIINPNTFFSLSFLEVLTNPNAINTQFFVVNLQLIVFIIIIVLMTSWQFDKLTSETSNIERSNAQLGRYFSPEIKEEIEKSGLNLNNSNKSQSLVAVLFTDINKFTSISENLKPEEVLKLVSEYQAKMVAAIFSSNGTVDKFIGDSVMATFGTPSSRGNDAQNALDCARKMQISMRQWAKERIENDLEPITHRIGIHFGPCVVGNIGNDQRVEFTVIGDTVNVASRLCEKCKDENADVLISEDLKIRLAEEINSTDTKDLEVRGRKEKITVHKLKL